MVILDVPVNRLAIEIIFFAGNLKPKNFARSVGAEVPPIGHLARGAANDDEGGSIGARIHAAVIEPRI
jgi:hypothetical protein